MTNWAMARATSGNQLVFGVGLVCSPWTSAAVTVDRLLGARFARSRRACGHTGGNAARASGTPYGCTQRTCDSQETDVARSQPGRPVPFGCCPAQRTPLGSGTRLGRNAGPSATRGGAVARSESYDYVIVGAGSAGAVIAARLTEDPATRVLLLEAGGPADADEISIPAAFSTLFKTRWDWNYTTTEQKQLHSTRKYWPRMKALGGCSSMNAMIYIRGNRADYDTWRDQYGAVGWGYDDLLPYFIRSEANTRLGAPYHGRQGPLHVEDRRYTHPLSEAWVESAVANGMKPTDDFNGAEQDGAGLYQVTCKKGRRWSVDKAYLEPAATRENLTVRTGALASRVLVEGGRAVAVA